MGASAVDAAREEAFTGRVGMTSTFAADLRLRIHHLAWTRGRVAHGWKLGR